MESLDVYTIAQLACYLQISTKTAYRIVKDGDIRSVKVRGQIRILSSALEDYFARGGKECEKRNTRQ